MCDDASRSGLDHACEPIGGCRKGPRPCPVGGPPRFVVPPGHCTPSPPAPLKPPPSPPTSPYDYVNEWQQYFGLLLPDGGACENEYYRPDIDYKLIYGMKVHADCANRCLRTPDCTAFEAPGSHSHCTLWLHGACSSLSSPGLIPTPTNGDQGYLTYVRIFPSSPPAAPPPAMPPSPAFPHDSCPSLPSTSKVRKRREEKEAKRRRHRRRELRR